MLPGRHAIVGRQRPQATVAGASRVFELDQRAVMNRAPVHPHMPVAYQRLCDIESIRFAVHAHDLAPVTVGLDDIDEYAAIADELDQSGASAVAIRLILFRRIDVLQAHVDVAPLAVAILVVTMDWTHEEAVAIEYFANGTGEVTIVGVGHADQQTYGNEDGGEHSHSE
jgi:hypothetical protein